jgi:3-dehydroquinate synthase
MACVDLDERIASRADLDIPEIFEREGEAGFRAREAAALQEALKEPQGVIALGGGALLDPVNRELAEQQGTVICLMAELTTLQERLGSAISGRPLLDQSPAQKLGDLYRRRLDHYQSFDHSLHVDGVSIWELVWEAQSMLGRFRITGMGRGYDVWIDEGLLDALPGILAAGGFKDPLFLVMDYHLAALYQARLVNCLVEQGLKHSVFTFQAGEESKILGTADQIWAAMAQSGVDRQSTCLAFGGGVTGDLAGFSASAFMRGMPWVNLPTSLLAMVDACLGGKTGVDLPAGKNLVGAFHPPGLVLVDPRVLDTLPEREFRTGMAEVIKHGVIADRALFEACTQQGMAVRNQLFWLISRSMAVKARVITEDPYEQGFRAALNFGHTIGHAVEKGMAYRLSHGESVAIGMVIEAWLAEQIGLAKPGLSETLSAALQAFQLPVDLPPDLTPERIMRLMQFDKKKRDGEVFFALPESIGQVRTGVKVDRLLDLLRERMRNG